MVKITPQVLKSSRKGSRERLRVKGARSENPGQSFPCSGGCGEQRKCRGER